MALLVLVEGATVVADHYDGDPAGAARDARQAPLTLLQAATSHTSSVGPAVSRRSTEP